MAAIAAAQPGEAVMRIAAFEEALDDVLLDPAHEAAARLQLRRVPYSALIERVRAHVARAVRPAAEGLRHRFAFVHASSNAP